MIILSFILFAASFAIAKASSIFPDGNELVARKSDIKSNGSPGAMCYADAYNNLGTNWNRTYTDFEPQQIHISLTDDAKHARVQFATLGEIKHSVLKYWPKSHKKSITTIQGENWVFVDGGIAQRKLYLHKLKSKSLRPATVYSYQVGSNIKTKKGKKIQWSKTYEFHSAPKKNDFNFLATGDIGACNAVAVSHLIELGKTNKYDFVTIAGDQAYNMEDFNGTKGDEYLNFMQDLFAQVPYMGAVGNHEAAYNFSHYKNRFNIVPYAESKTKNSLFYSFNYKSLHLVSFSTEIFFTGSPGEVDYAVNWLKSDLSKANKDRAERPWIIFLTHHPIYCSGNSSDCTTKAATIKDSIEDILLKYKVDIYMSGHVHNYERTYPVYKNKQTATSYHNAPSLFQIVIGNAGQPEGPTSFTAPYPEWSAVRYGSYGLSTFRVTPTALHIVHRAALTDGSLGDVIDQFSVTKDPIHHKNKRDNCVE
ncbi:unnamed protein product [Mucor hiemalis]